MERAVPILPADDLGVAKDFYAGSRVSSVRSLYLQAPHEILKAVHEDHDLITKPA